MSYKDFVELLGELREYFYETYFSPDFSGYKYINLGNNNTTLAQLLFGLAIGAIIACIINYVYKQKLGIFIRKLLKNEAFSPENAYTLEELGLKKKRLLRRSLSSIHSPIRKLVACTGAPDLLAEARADTDRYKIQPKEGGFFKRFMNYISPEKRERVDFKKAAWYIPEEKKYRAEVRFEKGESGVKLAVYIILLVIFPFACIRALPSVLQLCDAMIGWFST